MVAEPALSVDLQAAVQDLIRVHGIPAVRRAVLQVLGDDAAAVPPEIRWALEFTATKFPEWPFDFAKDLRLFQRVLAADRGLNVREALHAFEIYATGDRKRPVKNWRSAFRTWCANGRKWGKPWAGRPIPDPSRTVDAGPVVPSPPRVKPEQAEENQRAFREMVATVSGKLEMPR